MTLGLVAGVWSATLWLPFGLELLHPLAFLPLFLAFERIEGARSAALLGAVFLGARFAFGAHFFFALLSYSPLAVIFWLMLVAIAAFSGALMLLVAWGLAARAGVARALALVFSYTLFEWLRSTGPLGFPADAVAHAFGTFPAWLSFTAWLGPHAMTVFALALAAGLAHAWSMRARDKRRALGSVAIVAALWCVPPLIALAIDAPQDGSARVLRVGIVQPFVSVRDKRDPEARAATWTRLEALTRRAAQDVDVVIWPETARPEPIVWTHGPAPEDPRMVELARSIGVPILYGTEIARLERGQLTALYNGAALARPEGGTLAWYGKRRLLPFVEGIPFAESLRERRRESAARASGPRGYLTMMGHFSPGPEITLFEVGGAKLGVLICFEGHFPGVARAARLAGADALVVLTNDAWWGRSLFAPWHARMAASRARETGVPVVRAANSGVSSASTVEGRMVGASKLATTDVLRLEVPVPKHPPSAALHLQAWFPGVFFAGVLGWAAWSRRRRGGGVSEGEVDPLPWPRSKVSGSRS